MFISESHPFAQPETASPSRPRCEVCDARDIELFGYRKPDWRWFCAKHRLGVWYADRRLRPGELPAEAEGGA